DSGPAVTPRALASTNLAAWQEQFPAPQPRTAEVLANLQLPQLPTRPEILDRALAMYASTPSIEDIVDRAQCILAASASHRGASSTALRMQTRRPRWARTSTSPRISYAIMRPRTGSSAPMLLAASITRTSA